MDVRLRLAFLPLALLSMTSLVWADTENKSANESLQPIDAIVALVGEDMVTRNELQEQMALLKQQLRGQGMSLPRDSVMQKQVLDHLILKQIQLQLARQRGIRVSDDMLNRALTNIARQNRVSLPQFRQMIIDDGMDYVLFRENVREELMITRLRQGVVEAGIVVTEREIDDFLATQRTQGTASDEYHLGHILVSIPESASADEIDAAAQKASALIARLQTGEDFTQVALSASDGRQALSGGDLGWRKSGQLPTLFVDEVVHMVVGDVSKPIRSPNGFHIVKLKDHRIAEVHMITQTRARHILIKTNEIVNDSDARLRLQHLRQRIENGEDFAELARSHSDDGSAAEGGNLDWVSPGQFVPQFEQVMDELEIGELSRPFSSPFGWHIMEVLERRNYDDTEGVVREKAREAIRQRKVEEAVDGWIRQIREEAFVENRISDQS